MTSQILNKFSSIATKSLTPTPPLRLWRHFWILSYQSDDRSRDHEDGALDEEGDADSVGAGSGLSQVTGQHGADHPVDKQTNKVVDKGHEEWRILVKSKDEFINFDSKYQSLTITIK